MAIGAAFKVAFAGLAKLTRVVQGTRNAAARQARKQVRDVARAQTQRSVATEMRPANETSVPRSLPALPPGPPPPRALPPGPPAETPPGATGRLRPAAPGPN